MIDIVMKIQCDYCDASDEVIFVQHYEDGRVIQPTLPFGWFQMGKAAYCRKHDIVFHNGNPYIIAPGYEFDSNVSITLIQSTEFNIQNGVDSVSIRPPNPGREIKR